MQSSLSKALIGDQSVIVANLKDDLISRIKSQFIAEPDQQQTIEADEAMAQNYPLGWLGLPDSVDKLNTFCAERFKRNEIIDDWIRRRFTFNILVRMSRNLIAKAMEDKNREFCSDERIKERFVKTALDLKVLKLDLRAIRMEFIQRLIDISNTTFGISRLNQFCCSFWSYKKHTLDLIKKQESRDFIANMIADYFSIFTNYICYYLPENSSSTSCLPIEDNSDETNKHKITYDSIGIHLYNALSKITQIAL